jgi:hypothetical protein
MFTKKVSVKKTTKKTTKSSRKGVPPGQDLSPKAFRIKSNVFFLTFKGTTDSGEKIAKNLLAEHLMNEVPGDRTLRPEKYFVCEQTYESGQPHFHAILVYSKRKSIRDPTHYDFMGIHPNIQQMRNMKAALPYVNKEDLHPLTNMDLAYQTMVARAKASGSLYQLLQQQMLKDPFMFDVDAYCDQNGLFKQIYKANYAKAITLIKRAQPAAARRIMRAKPGIIEITQSLIHQKLNTAQIQQYFSDPCYARIISHINQIRRYPNKSVQTQAPLKTKHLLLVGEPDTGKTSLVYHRANESYPHNGLAHYYPTYYLSVGQKYFPPYKSYDYSLVNWQQFAIISDMFPKSGYARLLNYLDGSVSALPQKGRPPAQRQDNPKHILTSNRTLVQHIHKTFNSPQALALSLNNLPARVDCVVVPEGGSLHFLRKLLVPDDK